MLIHRPDLPPELDRLVLKLMAKDPADRYQSAAEMLADLAKMRDSLQVGATAMIPDTFTGVPARWRTRASVAATSGPSAKTESAPRRCRHPAVERRRADSAGVGRLARLSPRVLIATSAVCLLVGAIAGWNARNPDVHALASDAATRSRRSGSSRAGPPSQTEHTGRAVSLRAVASASRRVGPGLSGRRRLLSAISRVRSRRPTFSSRGSGTGKATCRRWARSRPSLSQWKDAQKRDTRTWSIRFAPPSMLKKGDLRGGRQGNEKPGARRCSGHV